LRATSVNSALATRQTTSRLLQPNAHEWTFKKYSVASGALLPEFRGHIV
jgi:hypothetical protein